MELNTDHNEHFIIIQHNIPTTLESLHDVRECGVGCG